MPVELATGLRERKKRAVRATLVEAALALFAEQGVDATSVEQISTRAGVSPRTFHRYFAAKRDVLFADADDRRERFAGALAARPGDEPLLRSILEATADLAAVLSASPRREALRQRIVDADDGLRARSLRTTEEWVDVVATHAAHRLGVSPHDLLPRLLGATTVGALRTARARWLANRSLDLAAEIRRCFELVADLERAIAEAATSR